jgi:hypothetical protein
VKNGKADWGWWLACAACVLTWSAVLLAAFRIEAVLPLILPALAVVPALLIRSGSSALQVRALTTFVLLAFAVLAAASVGLWLAPGFLTMALAGALTRTDKRT